MTSKHFPLKPQAIEETLELPVMCVAITLMWRHWNAEAPWHLKSPTTRPFLNSLFRLKIIDDTIKATHYWIFVRGMFAALDTPHKDQQNTAANISNNNDVIMSGMASQITSLTIVYSTVYSRRRSKKTSKLAFVRGIHRRPANSPRKGSIKRKMIPSDDVIMAPHTALH